MLDVAQDRNELVRQALGIGYEALAGELAGGAEAWRASGRPLATTGLRRDIDPAYAPLVDVRQVSEYRAGHIPGARPLELGSLADALDTIEPGATFMCGVGERAMTAASLAERAGRPGAVFAGGPRDWARVTGRMLERA